MSSYCELPEFYSETFPKARKSHYCCECEAPIEVGEKHLYYRGKWDGDFSTGRQHMLCREMCMLIRDDYQSGECIGFGTLFEYENEFHFSTGYGDNRTRWDADDRAARKMMATIKWRQRKHRSRRKRVNGDLLQKSWGQPWQVIEKRADVPGTG